MAQGKLELHRDESLVILDPDVHGKQLLWDVALTVSHQGLLVWPVGRERATAEVPLLRANPVLPNSAPTRLWRCLPLTS